MKLHQGQGYRIEAPQRRDTCVVFASPHSGRDYPYAFLRASVLSEQQVRSSEDAFVDELFAEAPQCGAPLIAAHVPRAFLDLNRAADELDPALIRGVSTVTHNPRISSGLGVIPRVVAGGRAIYRGKIEIEEAQARIADFWRPYHRALQAELDAAQAQFGEAILIDCHSMPHEALDSGARGRRNAEQGRPLPEVVLGDRFGASCGAQIMEQIEAAFTGAGFRVSRNSPFAGAYVAQRYGQPSKGRHAVQVEIDRALYMDEAKVARGPGFVPLRQRLAGVIAEIAEIGRRKRLPLAAE